MSSAGAPLLDFSAGEFRAARAMLAGPARRADGHTADRTPELHGVVAVPVESPRPVRARSPKPPRFGRRPVTQTSLADERTRLQLVASDPKVLAAAQELGMLSRDSLVRLGSSSRPLQQACLNCGYTVRLRLVRYSRERG